MFFLLCFLDDRRIRKAQKHMEPADPDPQHCLNVVFTGVFVWGGGVAIL
jgi:hypothetical protein